MKIVNNHMLPVEQESGKNYFPEQSMSLWGCKATHCFMYKCFMSWCMSTSRDSKLCNFLWNIKRGKLFLLTSKMFLKFYQQHQSFWQIGWLLLEWDSYNKTAMITITDSVLLDWSVSAHTHWRAAVSHQVHWICNRSYHHHCKAPLQEAILQYKCKWSLLVQMTISFTHELD